MLWSCLHFPALALNLVEQSLRQPRPIVIEITRQQRRLVLLANEPAQAAGIVPGMTIPTAQGLVNNLYCALQNENAEREALQQIGHWAYQFTPYLRIHGQNSLLMEISHSLKLFQGQDKLAQKILETLPTGFTPFTLAFCETAFAALLFARAHEASGQAMTFTLTELPDYSIDWLDINVEQKALLHSMGITTLGQLLELPWDALANRFGPALVDYLKQLIGEVPDLLPAWKVPEQFSAELEFIQELDNTEQLIFPFRNLLDKLEHYCRARQCAAVALQFCFTLRNRNIQSWPLALSTAQYRCADILPLLQLKLARLQLQAPVLGVQLQVTEFLPLPQGQQDLLVPWRSDQVSRYQLIDRLQARLGSDNVNGLSMVADHRPEYGWAASAPGDGKSLQHPSEQRPFWLLDQPQKLRTKKGMPIYQEVLQLIKGPERIETGWWDNQPISRDYFIARQRNGRQLWIYRNRDDQQWYLHGIFSA